MSAERMSTERMNTERHDTVVIGGGQAGLATGYYLQQQGRDFTILDAGDRIGATWRARWDSLRLFTPAGFTHLPGMDFPARRSHRPTKNEMADYLGAYAARFQLPVQLGGRVDQLARHGDRFVIRAGQRRMESERVVVATGPAMHARRPPFAAELAAAITQLHSTQYRNPDQLPPGDVLIVGAGNSGAEIALDVAATHPTLLAGNDTGRVPITVGGPLYRLMNKALNVDTRLGRKFAAAGAGKATPLVRVRPADLSAAGVERVSRVSGVSDGLPRLANGRVLDVATVIWCTGYVPEYRWITSPALQDGYPVHHRGVVAAEPGLYFIGLPFQSSPASSLVGGVGSDAAHITNHLAGARTPPPPGTYRVGASK